MQDSLSSPSCFLSLVQFFSNRSEQKYTFCFISYSWKTTVTTFQCLLTFESYFWLDILRKTRRSVLQYRALLICMIWWVFRLKTRLIQSIPEMLWCTKLLLFIVSTFVTVIIYYSGFVLETWEKIIVEMESSTGIAENTGEGRRRNKYAHVVVSHPR